MSGPSPPIDEIELALKPSGIHLRGLLGFDAGEGPRLSDGRSARSVVLLGNVGGSIWPAFSRWKAGYVGADPLDTWSKQIINPVAQQHGGTAYFPSDAPWQPFQQWAMRAESLKASPLGILIHPEYGLWHGYRGAIGFSANLAEHPFSNVTMQRHACDHCDAKPCLVTCPVSAVSCDPLDFDVAACRSHLSTSAGQGGCLACGCLARNACPVGSAHRYPAEQLKFHMMSLS